MVVHLQGKIEVGLGGVTVTAGPYTTVTVVDGQFLFTGIPDGTYVVTPSKDGWVFDPLNGTITVAGASVDAGQFEGTQP